MKDNHPLVVQLTENIETVEQWSRGPQAREHAAWLTRAVAWDVVLAEKMTWAARKLGEQGSDSWPARDLADEGGIERVLRSGLAEVVAGPGDHVISHVNTWHEALGKGRCHVAAASGDDLRWLRERLTLPPPKGAGPQSQQSLADYAKRASETRDIVRVDCGGAARLVVGILADRLVPILRE